MERHFEIKGNCQVEKVKGMKCQEKREMKLKCGKKLLNHIFVNF